MLSHGLSTVNYGPESWSCFPSIGSFSEEVGLLPGRFGKIILCSWHSPGFPEDFFGAFGFHNRVNMCCRPGENRNETAAAFQISLAKQW